MTDKSTEGFGAYPEQTRQRIARSGGLKVQELGKAYRFTRQAARKANRARKASLKLTRNDHAPLKSRKHEGRYEYYVKGTGWVSRQRVHQLRRQGKL